MAPPRELPKGGEPVNEGGRSVGASTVILKGVAKPTVGVGCVPSVSAPYGVKMVDLAKDLVVPRAWRPRGNPITRSFGSAGRLLRGYGNTAVLTGIGEGASGD